MPSRITWAVPERSKYRLLARSPCSTIEMPIAAIRPKGNHNIGSEAADDLDDLADQYVLVNLLEHPVTVVQAHSVLDTKSLAGEIEFLFPHLAKCATSGNPCTADLPRLTACR